MTTIYNVMELATALKPFLLRHLLAAGASSVTYLDPDIEVFAPLDDIDAAAERHGIVLTPHRFTPVPDDRRQPDERVFAVAGAYNLGFVAVGTPGRGLPRLVGRSVPPRLPARRARRAVRRPALGRPGGRLLRARTCCATPASTPPTGTSTSAPSSRRRAAVISRAGHRCGSSTTAATTPTPGTSSPATTRADLVSSSPSAPSCSGSARRTRRGCGTRGGTSAASSTTAWRSPPTAWCSTG